MSKARPTFPAEDSRRNAIAASFTAHWVPIGDASVVGMRLLWRVVHQHLHVARRPLASARRIARAAESLIVSSERRRAPPRPLAGCLAPAPRNERWRSPLFPCRGPASAQ